MSKPWSEFRADICCEHDWTNDGPQVQFCLKCPATCTRDNNGNIETYSLNNEYTYSDIKTFIEYNVKTDPKNTCAEEITNEF